MGTCGVEENLDDERGMVASAEQPQSQATANSFRGFLEIFFEFCSALITIH